MDCLIASLVILTATTFTADPEKPAAVDKIEIYVTPLYNSKGPQIAVGRWSKELTAATADTIRDLAAKMKKDEWDTLSPEVMYVVAIRLYDFDFKDDSVYWFYSAQWRSRLWLNLVSPDDQIVRLGDPTFERKQAFNAIFQLAGPYFNKYAWGKLKTLEKTLVKVREENQTVPSFHKIYPKQEFIGEDEWVNKNKVVTEGFDKLLEYRKTKGDEIRSQRTENGLKNDE